MESVGYVHAIRARWMWVAAATLTGILLALLAPPALGSPSSASTALDEAASTSRDRYVSTAVIGTPPTGTTTASSLVTQVGPEFATLVFYLRNAAVLDEFGNRIGYRGSDPAVLEKLLTMRADPQSGTITLSGTGGTPAQAVEITTAFIVAAQTYLDRIQRDASTSARRQTRAEIDKLQKRLDRLSARIQDLRPTAGNSPPTSRSTVLEAEYRTTLASYTDAYNRLALADQASTALVDFVIVQPAAVETVQLKKPSLVYSRALRLVLGLLLGLLVGIATALLLEHYSRRLTTRDAVERIFGRPVLGQLPRQLLTHRPRDIKVTTAPRSAVAVAYDTVASLILRQTGTSALALVSQDDGRGSGVESVVAVGSGTRGGMRLAGSADPEHSSAGTVLLLASAANEPSYPVVVANLATALALRSGRPVKVLRRHDRHDRMLLPAHVGDADGDDAAEREVVTVPWPLSTNSLPDDPTSVIAALTDEGALVVIDAGPVISAEFAAAAAAADDAVVVCEHRRTTIAEAERSAAVLRLSGVRLVGPLLAQDRTVGQRRRTRRFLPAGTSTP